MANKENTSNGGREKDVGTRQTSTLWTPKVVARDQVASIIQPDVPQSAMLGGRKVTIHPLPCGRAFAINPEGHVLGVGAPPKSDDVACTRFAVADIDRRLQAVSKALEAVSAEMSVVRASTKMALELDQSVVEAVRNIANFLSGDADEREHVDSVCDQVHSEIAAVRKRYVELLDKAARAAVYSTSETVAGPTEGVIDGEEEIDGDARPTAE